MVLTSVFSSVEELVQGWGMGTDSMLFSILYDYLCQKSFDLGFSSIDGQFASTKLEYIFTLSHSTDKICFKKWIS